MRMDQSRPAIPRCVMYLSLQPTSSIGNTTFYHTLKSHKQWLTWWSPSSRPTDRLGKIVNSYSILCLIKNKDDRNMTVPRRSHISRNQGPYCLGSSCMPEEHPTWDFTTEGGQGHVWWYQEALLQGVWAGVNNPMNMTKISSVTQHPGESPRHYYERFCEAYRVYIPFDPVAPESQQTVNTYFVAQAAPDIRRKLQKLEGFARC